MYLCMCVYMCVCVFVRVVYMCVCVFVRVVFVYLCCIDCVFACATVACRRFNAYKWCVCMQLNACKVMVGKASCSL